MSKYFYAIAVLVGVAVLAAIGYIAFHDGYTTGKGASDAHWSKLWAIRNEADSNAQLAREVAARNEEHRRNAEVEKITNESEVKKRLYAVTVAAAGIAGDGLRKQLSVVRNTAEADAGTSNACNAARGARDSAAIVLLTGLLEQSDRRAEERARFADETYAALQICNGTYNAVRNQPDER